MPRRSPHTVVASRLAQLAAPARADLHVHTTASDGEYTPSQVIELARQAGLLAVAVTDHDTLAAIPELVVAATNSGIELIPGVEISSAFGGREFHLLGYFVRMDHSRLNAALATVREARRDRFRDFITLLRNRGLSLPEDRVRLVEERTSSLGRRHVASLLVACGQARTRTEAFHRYVGALGGQVRAKKLVPIEEAIELVHAAGGVTSLAHPPVTLTDSEFASLRDLGLDALEVVYPWGRNSPAERLREVAARCHFALSGGSDCHGPDPAHRRIGSYGITSDELTALRERASCAIH